MHRPLSQASLGTPPVPCLSGSFVATVNADLRVGQLEETITVTGESPIVDVQSARTQSIIDREVLDAIPSSRNVVGIQAIIRGMNASGDDGGLTGVDAGRSVRDPRRASQAAKPIRRPLLGLS